MKRKIWVTAGIAAALAFLIAFGAVGCVVSGFDLPLDSYAKVVLICGAASVFCAAAFSLKWGGAPVCADDCRPPVFDCTIELLVEAYMTRWEACGTPAPTCPDLPLFPPPPFG